MVKRLDWSDRSATAAVLLGVLAAYLPWYAYSAAGAHVAVNGFRASVLGDIFFVVVAAEALLVLMRHGFVAGVLGGRLTDRAARIAVACTAAAIIVIQLVLVAAAGHGAGAGMLLAFFSFIAMATAAWLRGYDAEPRRTVREMLGEELPD